MTPNKKAPERVWVTHGDAYTTKALAACVDEIEHREYIRADLYDALKTKVLALECPNSRPGWSTSPSDVADSPCGWCLVCKLKEEVRKP